LEVASGRSAADTTPAPEYPLADEPGTTSPGGTDDAERTAGAGDDALAAIALAAEVLPISATALAAR
jgi:hypothetical protein